MNRALVVAAFALAACSDADATIDRSVGCAAQPLERLMRQCYAQERPQFEGLLRAFTDSVARLSSAPDSVRAAERTWIEMRARDCAIISDSLSAKGEGDLAVLECISMRNRERFFKLVAVAKTLGAPPKS